MEFLSADEASRALALSGEICRQAQAGLGVLLRGDDLELVALGLIVAVLASEHAEKVSSAGSQAD